MPKSTKQSVLFEGPFEKPVHVAFDAESQTSDAGLLLLRAADDRLSVTKALDSSLTDVRTAARITHSYSDLLRQRIFSIAAGYEDANDATRLRVDPALATVCDRSPRGDSPLASQPSLSRFENSITAEEAVRMGRALEDVAIGQLKRQRSKGKRRKRIIIDLDPSVDPAHGAQQGVLFHGFYGRWCYLPMLGFVSFEGGASQLLFSARLRPGTSRETRGTIPLLNRMVEKIRSVFGPRQGILVRLDAGFCAPGILEALESLGVSYVVGMGTNRRLKDGAAGLLPGVRSEAERTGETTRTFSERSYKARSWPHGRRVITKAEVIPYPGRATKDNVRHVVTNLRANPERVYDLYCLRGDAENRIKELKGDLHIDRTSCPRFVANQVRVILTAAAHVLYQEIRWRLRKRLGNAQVGRLMATLVKVSARVKETARRIVVHMPVHYPFQADWNAAARALGARAG